MAGYIGNFPTALPLTSSDLPDDIVTSAKIADGSITSADTDGSIGKPAFKNLMINGDMSIAQRSTSATSISSSGYHSLDRFRFGFTDTDQLVATISQDTDVPTGQGFSNSMKFLVTTVETALDADDVLQIQYRMEGQNLQQLKYGTSSAESLTLSFWVKSSVTGTYALTFKNSDDGGTQLYVNTYSISSANTWEKKTITISGDTSTNIDNTNGNKLEVLWGLSAGSNYTGTSSSGWTSYGADKLFNGQTADIATSSGATFYLTGVQLEVGTSASDFEFLPYNVNFQRCARYFYRQDYNTSGSSLPVSHNYTTGNSYGVLYMPVMMRVKPTLAYSSTSHFTILYKGSTGVPSQFVIEGGNGFSQEFRVDRLGLTQGESAWTRLDNASATFDLDSEL